MFHRENKLGLFSHTIIRLTVRVNGVHGDRISHQNRDKTHNIFVLQIIMVIKDFFSNKKSELLKLKLTISLKLTVKMFLSK